MSEASTPGPWHLEQRSDRIQIWAQGMLVCELVGLAGFDFANARLVVAAPDLAKAATLVDLMFERKNKSTADCDFMGDDEHEAWSAIRAALAKSRGEA